jgi:DNA-binding XRE family transcriptional regulator
MAPMPNITAVLKAEIARLSRKEIRAATDSLRKAAATQRTGMAALRRQIVALERAFRAALRASPSTARPRRADGAQEPESSTRARFTAKGLATNRRRLGLSAAEFGLLAGVSGQSIYLWETGKSRPRLKSLAAIVALRGISKKAALERLAGANRRS